MKKHLNDISTVTSFKEKLSLFKANDIVYFFDHEIKPSWKLLRADGTVHLRANYPTIEKNYPSLDIDTLESKDNFPLMTSNTTPEPYKCTASSCHANHAIWKAFNKYTVSASSTDSWHSTGSGQVPGAWIEFNAGLNKTKLFKYQIGRRVYIAGGNSVYAINFNIIGYPNADDDDGAITILSVTNLSPAPSYQAYVERTLTQDELSNQTTYFSRYRLVVLKVADGSAGNCCVPLLRFSTITEEEDLDRLSKFKISNIPNNSEGRKAYIAY